MIKFHIKPPGIHIDDGNLIQEVERRQFLYDTKSSDYRNLPLRAIVWDEIAKTLNVDDQGKVQKRWKVLREKFATAYRKEISEGTTCTWVLYEKLRFLESFINLVKNDSKVSMHSSNESLQSSSVAKSPLDEHALIRLIKQHPVIYNKKHDDFHSSSCRRRAWETISSKLKFDVSILQKRWRVIRDRFVRELRRTQYNDESNLSCSSFFRDMLFLARHIRSKNYAVEAHLENEVKFASDDHNCNDEDNGEDEENNEWILQQDDTQQDNVDDDSYQFIEETEDIEQVYEEEITQSEYIEEESETEMINAAPIEEIEAIHENWEKSEANSSLKRRASVEEVQDQPENKKRMKSQSPVCITETTDKDEDLAFGNTIGCMLKKIPQHLKTAVKLKLLTSLANFEAQHNLNTL